MAEALRQREPRRRDPAYLGAIAKLPCIACMVGGRVKMGVHVAHIRMADPGAGWRTVGKAEKPDDRRTAPICPGHHTDSPHAQHKIGEQRFWYQLGIRPSEFCAALAAAYDAGNAMLPVVTRFAAQGRNVRGTAAWQTNPWWEA